MAKCINCNEKNASYQHSSGGFVCENCIGSYFTCPDCGILYDRNDVDGDQGNGFCRNCSEDH